MIDFNGLVFAIAIGLIIAMINLTGLWLTVKQMVTARRPLSVYFSSLAVRLAMVLGSLFLVLGYLGWLNFVVCLAALMVSRLVILQFMSSSSKPLSVPGNSNNG